MQALCTVKRDGNESKLFKNLNIGLAFNKSIMKTEKQIRDKLVECETFIKKALKDKDKDLSMLVYLTASRDNLRWALAEGLIKPDKINKKIDFEILVIESTKIF